MDDYNLTKHQHHPAASEFIDLLFSCMFHPLKTKPTRLSATLIDNIWTNDISSTGSENGLIINDLSDHHPVFLLAHTFTSQKNSKQRIVTREFNDSDVTKFSSLLQEFDWSSVINNSPFNAYDAIISKYFEFYNICFARKITTGNPVKTMRNPWHIKD